MKRKLLFFILLMHGSFSAQDCSTTTFSKCAGARCTLSDLTNTYQTAQKLLSCTESEIKILPAENQQALLKSLAAVKKTIAAEYLDAKNRAGQKPANANWVDGAVQSGMYDIEQKVQTMKDQVTQVEASIGWTKKYEEERKKAIELAKEQAAYQEKMMKLFFQLQKYMKPFNEAAATSSTIKYDVYQKKRYDVAMVQRVEKATNNWQNVIKQLYAVYQQNNQTILIDDTTNYVVLGIRSLLFFYTDLIEIQLKAADFMKRDAQFDILYSVVTQLLGTGVGTTVQGLGFDKVVKQLIDTYFKDNEAYLNKFYLTAKVNHTYNRYKSALYSLAVKNKAPSQKELQYAEQFYALLISDNAVLQKSDQQEADLKSINNNLALLYLLSAQEALKNMRSDTDTTQLRLQAIDYFKKANTYFQQAGDTVNAQNCSACYTNLTKAADFLKQAQAAQNSKNNDQAVNFFSQAQAAFARAGDLVDAYNAAVSLLQVEVDVGLSQVDSIKTNVIKNVKDQLNTYLLYLSSSTITQNNSIDFTAMNAAITQGFQQILQQYSTIIKNYQLLSEQDSQAVSSPKIVALIHNLSDAVIFLSAVVQANALIEAGDKQAQGGTLNGFFDSESSYRSAIKLYQIADEVYKKNSNLVDYCPLYPATVVTDKTITWNYVMMMQCHSAKWYMMLAEKIQANAMLQLQYYMAAQSRTAYVSASVAQLINEKIKDLSSKGEVVEQIFTQAQQKEKEALAFTADAWKPQAGGVGYTSDANDAWESVLKQYIAAYRAGLQEAREAYVKAVDEYATAYATQVPPLFYPSLGSALIRYHYYVLLMVENQQEQADAVLKKIDDAMMPLFSEVEALMQRVDSSAFIETASLNQLKILIWRNAIDQGINQQEDVINEISPDLASDQKKLLALLEKTIDQNNNLTYEYLPEKKIVTLPDPDLKLADVYKEVADYYFQKKNYLLAFPNYASALQQYKTINRSDKVASLQSNYELAKTLYNAALYIDVAVPIDSVNLYGFTAPQSYALKMYKQTVPKIITDTFPSVETLQKYSEQERAQFTLSVSLSVYFYNWIKQLWDNDDEVKNYPRYLKMMQDLLGASEQEVKTKVTVAFEDVSLQAQVQMLMKHANELKATLQARLTQKKSSFVLQQERTKNGDMIYVLYEFFVGLPRWPTVDVNTSNIYYLGYPSAQLLYYWASLLFAPGQNNVMVNGGSFVPGNRPEEYAKVLDALAQVYISDAYTSQAEIDRLKASDDYKKLTKIVKTDMTAKIADYRPLYDSMNSNYQDMIQTVDGLRTSDTISQNPTKQKSLTTFVGNLYTKLGDDLTVFLIGDPLLWDYHGTVLFDIAQAYSSAIVTYQIDPLVYLNYAKLCAAAGDLLVQQKKYYISSFFYTKAEQAYATIKQQTPELLATARTIAFTRLKNVCKAGMQNIADYIDARKNGIDVKQDDGSIKKEPLDEVILKYNQALSQQGGAEGITGLDKDAVDHLNTLKSGLLDSLIFFSSSALGVKNDTGQGSVGFNNLAQNIAGTSTIDTFSTAAIKQLQAFMKNNNLVLKNEISVDSINTLTLALSQNALVAGKSFVTVLNDGFETLEQKEVKASTNQDKIIAYMVLSQWCTLLFNVFSSLYIQDFLGGMPVDPEQLVTAVQNLNTSIDTEKGAMNTVVGQYFKDQNISD